MIKFSKGVGWSFSGRRVALPLLMLVIGMEISWGQTAKPATACVLTGTDTVSAGSTASFTLGPCTASAWTASCGTITAQGPCAMTINFAGVTCGNLTITASNGSTTLATKKVIAVQSAILTSGTIGASYQSINYHQIPQLINAPPATGGSCGGAYVYQWLSSSDSINYSAIPGATGQNYQPGSLTSTTYFRRQTSCGGSVLPTTNSVKIAVYPALAGVTLSPATQEVNYNKAPNPISLAAMPAIASNLSYLWQKSSSGNFGAATTIAGVASGSYAPGILTTTTYYRVGLVRNGDTLFSAAAVVNVLPQLVGGTVSPAVQSVAYDSVPALLSITGVTGGNGNYSYQWYSSADGNSWNLIDGVTSPGYIPAGMGSTTYYRVVVTSNGLSATAIAGLVNVN